MSMDKTDIGYNDRTDVGKTAPLLSIVTINYNGGEVTCQLLDSIRLHQPDAEVIVVDNGSRGNDVAMLRERYPEAVVIEAGANLGFAGGNNVGIRAAHGKYILMVNNDAELTPGGVTAMMERIEHLPDAGLVSPKILFHHHPGMIQYAGYTPLSQVTLRNAAIGFGCHDNGQYDTPHPTPYAHGAAMMASREAIDRAGLMPEDYFLYYEELDWSVMFARAGMTNYYEPGSTITHKESATTGAESPLKVYYNTRNRLVFACRNIPAPARWMSYIYIGVGVAMRDIMRYALHGRMDLVKAVARGIRSFARYRRGTKPTPFSAGNGCLRGADTTEPNVKQRQ